MVATIEQAVIGGVLGLAFHFAMSVIGVLGFMVSSQMGLSMAVMNDPLNGQSSDVVSALLSVLAMIVFFAIDGHLVLAGVIGASFKAWPLGMGWNLLLLQTVAYNVAWIFSAAMLLALPIVFSTLVVQAGLWLPQPGCAQSQSVCAGLCRDHLVWPDDAGPGGAFHPGALCAHDRPGAGNDPATDAGGGPWRIITRAIRPRRRQRRS